jgi:mannose-6-phosphate isomerase-like protein (cupin superfamily)
MRHCEICQPRFNKLYAKTGRPSIAPEKLLRALLLQALYSVRSERLLMEQLDYNLLFRWFVGLNMDDAIWDVTVFTKNRERLLDGEVLVREQTPLACLLEHGLEESLGNAREYSTSPPRYHWRRCGQSPRRTSFATKFDSQESGDTGSHLENSSGELIMDKINIADKFAKISEYWKPYIAAELNGQHVKLDKLKGEFVFHHHEHEDEMFLVVKGRFRMEFGDRHDWINEGEFIVVPRGVEHRPVADEECWILLFEPASTLNTGNVVNERTLPRLERV